MTKLMGRDQILGMATAAPKKVTKKDILLAAVAIIEARLPGQPAWRRFHELEGMGRKAMRKLSVAGTPLQAIADAAVQLGAPLTTGTEPATIGDILDRGLLTKKQVHAFSCDCGEAISDADAAKKMREIAG